MWEKSHGTNFIQSETLKFAFNAFHHHENNTTSTILKEQIMFCQKPHGFLVSQRLLLGIHLFWKKRQKRNSFTIKCLNIGLLQQVWQMTQDRKLQPVVINMACWSPRLKSLNCQVMQSLSFQLIWFVPSKGNKLDAHGNK